GFMWDHDETSIAKRYLADLDLEWGATIEDVRRSYRQLVLVWHPDRFTANPDVRATAEERIKRINEAYAWLRSNPRAWDPAQASRDSSYQQRTSRESSQRHSEASRSAADPSKGESPPHSHSKAQPRHAGAP